MTKTGKVGSDRRGVAYRPEIWGVRQQEGSWLSPKLRGGRQRVNRPGANLAPGEGGCTGQEPPLNSPLLFFTQGFEGGFTAESCSRCGAV